MLESFALNGRVGDIGIKDKTIEVKLVFPNDERTQDELAFLFPIKKGLATVRIIAAVNKGYVPGRRRSDRDETGTPLLPGVDMNEICHACGRTVDCVNEPFFAKPVDGGKEIILCDACYRVPQPETIETSPLTPVGEEAKAYYQGPCSVCGTEYLLFFSRTNHPIGSACLKCQPEEYARLEKAADQDSPADTLLGHPIVENPSLKSGEVVFGTVEQIGDPDLVTESSSPEQLEKAADEILAKAPSASKCCAVCGHQRGEKYVRDIHGKDIQVFWKTIENDEGTFEQCPKCAHLNQFPEEGGGKEGGEAA